MTKFFDIILENCMNGQVRMIVIEREGEEGVRSVRDIYESSITAGYTSRFFGLVADLLETEGSIALKNENIDFGRAKRWGAKLDKVMTTLAKEGRYN
jgi:hypothetical protein